MKYLIIILSLISINSIAEDYELGISYARVNQELFGTISFPMDAVIINGTVWNDAGFGVRLSIGRSTMTANSMYVKGRQYSNKIKALYSASALYRFNIGKFKVITGVGKTDYKSVWTVNGESPVWANGTDSDWSYYAEITYPVEGSVYLSFGYADIYRKDKAGQGREETRAFTAGFVYLF